MFEYGNRGNCSECFGRKRCVYKITRHILDVLLVRHPRECWIQVNPCEVRKAHFVKTAEYFRSIGAQIENRCRFADVPLNKLKGSQNIPTLFQMSDIHPSDDARFV